MIPEVPELRTERLLLRVFTAHDIPGYAALCADAEVMAHIGDASVPDEAATWRAVATVIGHWALRGYGPWAVVESASGEVVGRAGLWFPPGWPGVELGWLLGRAWWGRGYAIEAATAALTWARAHVQAQGVGFCSVIQPANTASIRLAERLGAVRAGAGQVGGHDVLLYRYPD